MFSENQRQRLGTALLIWLGLLGEHALDWIMKGRSPLVWPTFFGVLEWLAWTAVAGGIVEIGYHQLSKELPNNSRSEDAIKLIGYLARTLLSIALLFAIGGARFVLYAGDALYPHWRTFASALAEYPSATIALGAGIFLLVGWLALLIFACRLLGVMFRSYSGHPLTD